MSLVITLGNYKNFTKEQLQQYNVAHGQARCANETKDKTLAKTCAILEQAAAATVETPQITHIYLPTNVGKTSTYLDKRIEKFYSERNPMFKKPLEKIINAFLEKCRYINGESLERHNWGSKPVKLTGVPKDLNLESFEKHLLGCLEANEGIDRSIIELLWGDIQLGKRIQACIIMWISIHILKRPVLYIFRNLTIDQKQLQDDIVGTEEYNFNIQYIKNMFKEFNEELEEEFQQNDYWKQFKLPELKDIRSDEVINKLHSKDAINYNDIFCCLMNLTQLEKINKKFSEYVSRNDELVNITVLVDEADLMSPTSSNDRSSPRDMLDSTACERELAKLYKKVRYVLQITGTAHSLLYNITTKLTEDSDIQMKISKVHKMKRTADYYGIFNGNITFNTDTVKPWWFDNSYTVDKDYGINIKPIIMGIVNRSGTAYNSLLISEEKIRINHFKLVLTIMSDFPNLFLVVFHGNCLRLYLCKTMVSELKYWAQKDSEASTTGKRLYQENGIYGLPTSVDERGDPLPNDYCYYDIDTRKMNIKLLYKLVRLMWKKSTIAIPFKTVITITGKYGERGYSFTSDDYECFTKHITDQYFVSHATFNCTDISQRLRIQGKYNDLDLRLGKSRLTVWTTKELEDVIVNFYVKFIKEIEKRIMDCADWSEIVWLLESIIDSGDFKFKKYMKYLDVSKKRKNIKTRTTFDERYKGHKLFLIESMSDAEIGKVIDDNNKIRPDSYPRYEPINEIRSDLSKQEFIEKYGVNVVKPCFEPIANVTLDEVNRCIKMIGDREGRVFNKATQKWVDDRTSNVKDGVYSEHVRGQLVGPIKQSDIHNEKDKERFGEIKEVGGRRVVLCYDNDKLNVCVIYKTTKKEMPPKTHDVLTKTPFHERNGIIYYSVLLKTDKPLASDYFWKSPDDWLIFVETTKTKKAAIRIVAPQKTQTIMDATNTTAPPTDVITHVTPIVEAHPLSMTPVNFIEVFTKECFTKPEKHNYRSGLGEIYEVYVDWCKLKSLKPLRQIDMRDELRKLDYNMEISKGVGKNNKRGKEGYHILAALPKPQYP